MPLIRPPGGLQLRDQQQDVGLGERAYAGRKKPGGHQPNEKSHPGRS
jgi:hypothetical protein